jgi:hypothetical protein
MKKVLSLFFILSAFSFSQEKNVINLGSRRELFVDSFMIENMSGCLLRMHHPLLKDTAIKFDKPWEGKFSGYTAILKDDSIYRMYYRGASGERKKYTTCYAESKDGVTWTKPNLHIHAFEGDYNNNIVIANDSVATHNFTPFIDRNPNPKIKYKFKAVAGEGREFLHAYVSNDGLHWKELQKEPVYKQGIFDSQNMVFWSETEKCYVMYFRTWTGENYTGFRTISRATSQDFINWSDSIRMDFGNTPMEQLYTNGTLPYFRAPHIYVSMAKRFFPDKAFTVSDSVHKYITDSAYAATSSDAVFFTTRGGNKYDRVFMESFILPGEDFRDWISRDNTPAAGIVCTNPRELYIYRHSHYAQKTAHLSRYSLRIDGFSSLRAEYSGGEMTTKPFRFDGSKLEINFAASPAGGIKVEIQDENGNPMENFTLQDSKIIIGDEISRIVEWKSGTDLRKLSGKTVKMRFVLKDADIYSFSFF